MHGAGKWSKAPESTRLEGDPQRNYFAYQCKSALAGEPSGFCLLVCLFTGALYILEYPVLFVDKKLRLLEIKKTCSRSPRESMSSCLAVEFKAITDPSRLFPLRTERAFAQECSQDVSEPLKTL